MGSHADAANLKPRTRSVDISTTDPQTAITERVAAEVVLGIANITLTQRRLRGEAPPHFKVGRNIRYRLADVIAWRDARMVGKP